MKLINGWWVPDKDKTSVFLEYNNKTRQWNYQAKARNDSLGLIKNPETKIAIDVGAHIGYWAKDLASKFKHVYCFEPKQEHIECLERNLKTHSNITIYPFALGHLDTDIKMCIGGKQWNTGSYSVAHKKIENRHLSTHQMKTLDSLNLKPDYIKIDVEGYEFFVIKGGLKTIKESKPVMVIEQKGGAKEFGKDKGAAVKALQKFGMKMHTRVHADFIMKW